MKKVQFWIRDYFAFSQVEVRGFIGLGVGILLLLVLPVLYQFIQTSPPSKRMLFSFQNLDSLLSKMPKQLPANSSEKLKFASSDKNISSTQVHSLFPINPNQASLEDWKKIGLPPYAARNIIKYRDKGGVFKKKEDLKRIYGFPLDLYNRLIPYLVILERDIPQKTFRSQKNTNLNQNRNSRRFIKKPKISFEINQATSKELQNIRGIGVVFSQRIIKLREEFGGFIAWNQLHKVTGLQSSVIEELKRNCTLDSLRIRKISINQASFEELLKHPYISLNEAKAVVNYRDQHGAFQEIEDLAQIKLINSKLLHKLAPYLSK